MVKDPYRHSPCRGGNGDRSVGFRQRVWLLGYCKRRGVICRRRRWFNVVKLVYSKVGCESALSPDRCGRAGSPKPKGFGAVDRRIGPPKLIVDPLPRGEASAFFDSGVEFHGPNLRNTAYTVTATRRPRSDFS